MKYEQRNLSKHYSTQNLLDPPVIDEDADDVSFGSVMDGQQPKQLSTSVSHKNFLSHPNRGQSLMSPSFNGPKLSIDHKFTSQETLTPIVTGAKFTNLTVTGPVKPIFSAAQNRNHTKSPSSQLSHELKLIRS